jgi:RNA polymerase sigma-70 factor, ECF subfamily
MTVMCNSSSTNHLLGRIRTRDERAAGELFARHAERLRQMVRLRLDRRLRARFTSSAVLEDVWREAQRRLGEYSSETGTSFFLWLRRLTGARIQALHKQHLGTQAAAAGQEVNLYRGALPEANAASIAGQLLGQRSMGQAAQAALQVRLQEALNGMERLDREILSLCHFEDLSNREAALVLGIDEATASNAYVRALKRLKEILSAIPGFLDSSRR